MGKQKCDRCDDELPGDGDYVSCRAGCKQKYHIECSGLSMNSYRSMSEVKRNTWKCVRCRSGNVNENKNTRSRSKQEETKSVNIDGSEEIVKVPSVSREGSGSQFEGQGGSKRGSVADEEDLNQEVSANHHIFIEINNKLTIVTNEITDLKKAVQFISDKYDMLLTEMKDLKIVKDKYELVNDKVEQLEMRMNDLEQYSRCKNIEIKGVELTANENLKQVVVKIVSKMGVEEVSEKAIEVVHRVNNRNNREPKDIIVQFKDREVRDRVIAKKREKIYNKDITNGKNDNLIFVNEHMTTHNKQMFWEARNKCRDMNYKYVWTKDGKIFVRKQENERVFRIRNLEDLKKIC